MLFIPASMCLQCNVKSLSMIVMKGRYQVIAKKQQYNNNSIAVCQPRFQVYEARSIRGCLRRHRLLCLHFALHARRYGISVHTDAFRPSHKTTGRSQRNPNQITLCMMRGTGRAQTAMDLHSVCISPTLCSPPAFCSIRTDSWSTYSYIRIPS